MKNQDTKYLATDLTISSINAAKGDISGEVDLNWDAIENADSYVIELCKLNGKSKWNLVDITDESKYTVKDLKQKETYLFRVAAVDSRKQGPWSEPVKKKVL